jgi:hypothetical protein
MYLINPARLLAFPPAFPTVLTKICYTITFEHAGSKNRMVITSGDSRPFVVSIHMCRKRTMDQVKNLMKQQLTMQEAVEYVKSQVNIL